LNVSLELRAVPRRRPRAPRARRALPRQVFRPRPALGRPRHARQPRHVPRRPRARAQLGAPV